MRTFIALLFVLPFLLTPAVAQEITSTKLDLYSKRMLNNPDYKWDDINLFVKGDPEEVEVVTEVSGGLFKYTYGGISAVTIPIVNLEAFLAHPEIVAVENGDIPVQLLTDTAILINNVLQVHNGASPLAAPFTGAGVVLGIVDDGIYFAHEDFKKANGDTRVRFLWDMTVAAVNSPQPYGYGRQWTELEINNGTCTHVERVNAFSHGTHVSGIAAGNGRALGKYKGMAPEADIVSVAFDYSRPFLSSIVDAFDYIYKKADAMGKPCVINASLGTYSGSHDGKDFAAILIDALLDERSGRALVCAAGNAGQHKFHLGYDVTADTSFTWFKFNSSQGDIFFQLWADTADFNNVSFSFGAMDPTTWTEAGTLGFLNVKDDYAAVILNGGALIKNFSLNSGSLFVGSISTQLTLTDDGRYLYEAIISPNNTGQYWSFITTGSGKFDIWSSKALMDYSDMVYSGLPTVAQYSKMAYYKEPDTMQTMVSSYACSDHVITVGNYVNRGYYVNVINDTTFCPFELGAIFVDDNPVRESSLGSSYGPTRDGKQKPDISAPGTYVLATGNQRFVSDAVGSGNAYNIGKIAQGGKHNRNTGTSMSSPMVAGAAALYLQYNPTATWREVRDAFNITAFTDAHTGLTPTYSFGYGKLDVYAALQINLSYGCTDTAAINYDASYNMDDGSCIYPIWGCTNPLGINYNALANADDGSCFYDTIIGITATNEAFIKLSVQPNPNNGSFNLVYELPNNIENAELQIVNLLGAQIANYSLANDTGILRIHEMTAGLYIYHLKSEGKVLKEGKIIVY